MSEWFRWSIVGAHIEAAIAGNSSGVLLLLDSLLEFFDLFFEELSQKLAELVEGDFSWLIIVQDAEYDFVSLLEVSAAIALTRMDSFQETLHESFNFLLLQRTRIVGVDGIENRLVDLREFLLVNKDIGEVLDGFLEIHFK